MLRIFLLLIVLAAVWVGVVWLALPINLAAFDVPSLVSLHVAPPVLVVFVWQACKRVWSWNAARQERIRAAEVAAKEEEERAAKAAAFEAELTQRRAFIECRAAWFATTAIPEWLMDESPQRQSFKLDADALRGGRREAALSSSLQQVFEAALSHCMSMAYLPFYLLHESDIGIARKVWQELLPELPDSNPVTTPDFRCLPDSDDPLPDRLIALFESEPNIPALWLIGMDSLLENAPEPGIEPGHAVAAIIVSRPNLTLSEVDTIEKPDESNQLIPHWERDYREGSALWERIPPALREEFLQIFPPFATLHRARTLSLQGDENRIPRMERKFRGLIEPVLIDAALRDPPPIDEGEAKEPEPLDLGHLFHNCGPDSDRASVRRVMSILSALQDFDCQTDKSNVLTEHGDTGAASPVLMLAEAAACAAITQLPVMVAESGPEDRVDIGIVRPTTRA